MNRINRLFMSLLGATAVTILAMLSQSFIPGANLVALAGVLVLPGISALLLIRPAALTRLEQVMYVSGLSVLILMLSGLASNELFWALGNRHPLAAAVQVPWMGAVMLVLLAAAWLRNRKQHSTEAVPVLSAKTLALGTAFLAIPGLSALGAVSVNSGGTNIYTLVAYSLISVVGLGMVMLHKRVAPWLWAWAIFCMGLAFLWSTSLRGLFISGHDVQLEYYVFRLTDASKHWTMSNLQDAYNACLSITILPTLLKSLTGIDAIALYKVVYQIFFALCGVGILGVSRRYASSVVSFLAAFVFITFPTFVTDMPMLNRQEVAFNFFVMLLLVMLNRKLSPRVRRILFVLFGLGVVLSHYSTTFVMVALLGGTYALLWLMRLIAKMRHRTSERTNLTLSAVLVVALSTFLWTGLYTKTGNNITAQIAKVAHSLPTILNPKTDDSSAYTLLKSSKPTSPQQWVDLYDSEHSEIAAESAASKGGLYTDSSQYPLKSVDQTVMAITPLGKFLQAHGIAPGKLNALGKQVYALGMQAAILVGAAIAFFWRKRFHLNADFIALAPAGIALLVVQTVLPVIDYGLFRMLQQDLIFLALPIVLAGLQILKWLKVSSSQWRLTIIASAFALSSLVLSGVTPALIGGSVGQLPLTNSGFYYDAYYTTSQDIGMFNWLKTNYPKGYPINADTFTRMKIMANTGITTLEGIAPDEVTHKSYVVLTGANVTEDQVGLYYHGQQLFYQYPTDFLNANKNLVYSSNRTRVYH